MIDAQIRFNLFIKKARLKWGNKYNYDKSIYFNAKTKIEIICPTHGIFWQMPDKHLSGECWQCGIDKRKISFVDFCTQAEIIHDKKFDYSKSIYLGTNKKIKIVCFIHGSFWQTPNSHLLGHGCDSCYRDSTKLTFNEFLLRAKKIHDAKYDYSKTIYLGTNYKVEINCFTHGSFYQYAGAHLAGRGCRKCSKNTSYQETSWLNSCNLPMDSKYRQVYLNINGRKIFVDGFDPVTNTVYEFYGNFYHGNPEIYKSFNINFLLKKTFGELYQKTLEKENLIKSAGYKLITKWSEDKT